MLGRLNEFYNVTVLDNQTSQRIVFVDCGSTDSEANCSIQIYLDNAKLNQTVNRHTITMHPAIKEILGLLKGIGNLQSRCLVRVSPQNKISSERPENASSLVFAYGFPVARLRRGCNFPRNSFVFLRRTAIYIYVICRLGGPYWEKLCQRS